MARPRLAAAECQAEFSLWDAGLVRLVLALPDVLLQVFASNLQQGFSAGGTDCMIVSKQETRVRVPEWFQGLVLKVLASQEQGSPDWEKYRAR